MGQVASIFSHHGGITMQCKGTVFLFGAIICGVLVSVPVQAQEICRTAGFWRTPAGVEKINSTNIN